MDSDGNKFGKGPRELTGAVDLISHYKLLAHHDFFCKRSLPLAISDTHYLHNIVGDTEIRKGEGMELDQLVQNAYLRDKPAYIQPFDMETLGQAFQLRETSPVDLPSAEKGIPTISGKPKNRSKDKDKKKDKSGHHDSGGDHSKKHHEKKRKHEGMEDSADVHKHKKSKHKSSKTDDMGNGLSFCHPHPQQIIDTMNKHLFEAASEEHVLPAIYLGLAALTLGNM
ncbi:hypothetical protein GUJ93_ZPchr0009g1085 [Zizania palustris]|uniref:Mediator of RNA polymerase II transcription subunit 19a n=1 Tax=Zizania palustris TaxID=103762 RepID=A0A8J5V6H7_ZIZPA|nr:hypothetical protein GUJ93_ZPchr0009g1085 [Zizania palustris]